MLPNSWEGGSDGLVEPKRKSATKLKAKRRDIPSFSNLPTPPTTHKPVRDHSSARWYGWREVGFDDQDFPLLYATQAASQGKSGRKRKKISFHQKAWLSTPTGREGWFWRWRVKFLLKSAICSHKFTLQVLPEIFQEMFCITRVETISDHPTVLFHQQIRFAPSNVIGHKSNPAIISNKLPSNTVRKNPWIAIIA